VIQITWCAVSINIMLSMLGCH